MLVYYYRDCCINKEIMYMQCQDIAYTKSFDMNLTSADGQELEFAKWTGNTNFIYSLKISWTSEDPSLGLLLCYHRYYNMYKKITDMHCQDIACTKSFDTSWTSADG